MLTNCSVRWPEYPVVSCDFTCHILSPEETTCIAGAVLFGATLVFFRGPEREDSPGRTAFFFWTSQ